jgi:hypothetical protein
MKVAPIVPESGQVKSARLVLSTSGSPFEEAPSLFAGRAPRRVKSNPQIISGAPMSMNGSTQERMCP